MLFTVRFAPAGVTTWIGGSESHQSTIADAGATPANESAAAITAAAGRILKSLISSLRVEPVTDATNGVDESPLTRRLQLLANARHVHLERVRFGAGILRPHGFAELGVGHETAAVAHERGQDPELDASQSERSATALRRALAQVEGHIADRQPRVPVASVPADDRLHTGHELLERERLRDIIVGAHLQAGDPVAHG